MTEDRFLPPVSNEEENDLAEMTDQYKKALNDNYIKNGYKASSFFLAFDYEGVIFDLSSFLKVLSLKYVINENSIEFSPETEYEPEEDFLYKISYEGDLITGHCLCLGREETGDWSCVECLRSKDGSMMQIVLENRIYRIRKGDFRDLYRYLRILTASSDAIGSIEYEIEKELR